jgi:transcriptional regulator
MNKTLQTKWGSLIALISLVQIIFLRYYKGKTQTEIAKIMGITQVQVSRIEKRVLENMRVKLAI